MVDAAAGWQWTCLVAAAPSTGIWAGLHCPPVFTERSALQAALAPQPAPLEDLEGFLHVLTHRDLHLHPVQIVWEAQWGTPVEGAWFSASDWERLGMSTPIRKLLKNLP